MCDISPYGVIGREDNPRLMDVVDEMSRDDWFVKPFKPNPIHATAGAVTAANAATTVFTRTDAGAGILDAASCCLLPSIEQINPLTQSIPLPVPLLLPTTPLPLLTNPSSTLY